MNTKTAIHATVSVVAHIVEFGDFYFVFGNVLEDICICPKRQWTTLIILSFMKYITSIF